MRQNSKFVPDQDYPGDFLDTAEARCKSLNATLTESSPSDLAREQLLSRTAFVAQLSEPVPSFIGIPCGVHR
jgi:hypothetical protein